MVPTAVEFLIKLIFQLKHHYNFCELNLKLFLKKIKDNLSISYGIDRNNNN